ncbi:unnamed protein product [Gongylonema pulchrum]|uniref:Reverse transcriptase domain-containing protein n=1 Tax=Gongylonema pulchrum TaxID=637853 RepID=A0A183DZ18_9BILA|nr:unnamed protein product [Gongylonema pulchrum]
MDGNASPDNADLTLSAMEYRFLRENPGLHFHLFRYIDDILTVNCANFAKTASNIYGPSLKLNTTYSGQRACFLDLEILCQDSRCIFDIYNKTLDYPFTINYGEHPDSDMDHTVQESVILSQLLRYARISILPEWFLD